MNIQQALFFSFLKKTKPIKPKKININYLVMVLIKVKLLIFLLQIANCKLRVANYDLNFKLQFSKIFAESDF